MAGVWEVDWEVSYLDSADGMVQHEKYTLLYTFNIYVNLCTDNERDKVLENDVSI